LAEYLYHTLGTGDDRRGRGRWALGSSGMPGAASTVLCPLPLMGRQRGALRDGPGGCALGAMLGLTVHIPLYYEAGLSPVGQRIRARADSFGSRLRSAWSRSEFGSPLPGRHHHRPLTFFRALAASFTVAAVHRDPADGAGPGLGGRRTAQRRRR